MSFFNKKEEVLAIEITPHGKELMSKGLFHPKYYCFFDDDIIYDSSCYGLSEKQNDTQDRILEEIPYLKPNNRFTGCTTRKNFEYSNFLGIPLTSCDDSQQLAPSFNIAFIDTEVDTVDLKNDKIYNRYGSVLIPQINLKPKNVKIKIKTGYYTEENPLGPDDSFPLEIRDDESYVTFEIPKIKFDIFEENVEMLVKNFDIEVYKINPKTEEPEKLLFSSNDVYENVIIDELLVNKPQVENVSTELEFKEEDIKKVSSYFSITLDDFEGDEDTINRNSRRSRSENGDRLFIYDNIRDIAPRGNKC